MRQLKPWDVLVDKLWTRNIVSKVDGDTIEVRVISLDGSIVKERININEVSNDKEYIWLNVMDFIKSSNEERLFNQVFAIDSFDELKVFIKWQSSIWDYSAKELIGIIEQFRLSPTGNLSTITRHLWLRNKVALLRNNDFIEKNSTLRKLWPKWLENNTMQWTVWNCYFVAAFNSLKNHPRWWEILSDIITELPWWKSWEVRFKWHKDVIIIDQKDLDEMWTNKIHDFNEEWNFIGNSNIWDNIIERAYDKIEHKIRWWESWKTMFSRDKKNKLLFDWWFSDKSMHLIFWDDVKVIWYENQGKWKIGIFKDWDEKGRVYGRIFKNQDILETFKSNLEEWNLINLSSLQKKWKDDTKRYMWVDYFGKEIDFAYSHAYTLYSFNKNEGYFSVINPWNSWTKIKLKIEDFTKYFSGVSIAKFK